MAEIFYRELPEEPLEFTGERLTTAATGQVEIEHLHRYFLARDFGPGRDVLDIASGEGYGAAILAQVARSVVGVDISEQAVRFAVRNYRKDNLSFRVGDARNIPLPDAAVDVVVSFETIEHLHEHEQFLSEIKRVLRPGGLLVMSSPDRDVYSSGGDTANPFHVRELTAAEFTALLSRYFAHVAASGQRCFLGSALLPLQGEPAGVRSFERRSEVLVEGADGPARAVYIFALASDNPIEGAATSIYIHSPDVDGPARRIAAMQAELQQAQAALAAADDRLAVLAPDEPGATAPRTRIAQGAEAAARTTSLAGVERSGPCQNARNGQADGECRMNLNQGDHINPASQLAHLASVGEWDAAVEVGLHHLGGGQEDGNLFLRIASLLLEAQMIDAAEACIQQGYIRWPEYVWLPWQYAQLATTHRDFEVAATRWQDLMARHPESPLGLSGLAELHRVSGREDDAARLFAEAVTRYPDYVWAAHHHADTLTRCHDWPAATRRWAAVRDRFPDHIPAHAQLAHALMEDERLPEAEEAARSGLAAFPQDESLAAIAARVEERMRERTVEFFVCSAFQHLLQRDPKPNESAHWVKLIREGMPEREFFRQMVNSYDYKSLHPVIPGHPPGHFYSPVVNPTEAAEYWRKSKAAEVSDLSGIPLDIEGMEEFWRNNGDFMVSMQFAAGPGGRTRYYWDNGLYPVRDAMVLAGMINQYRPRRIIEVGSGFSTAAILDTVDRLDLRELNFTSIDLDATTLRSFLRPEDHARVTIIESKVQDVPVATFADLQAGDILLIDSTHVVKTGSDVHYELFSVLPALQPGVVIHFHDIDFPFEYHEMWVFQNRWSWNEAYVLRAFLSYNSTFRVVFFTDLFFKQHAELTEAATAGLFDHRWRLTAPGGSIWITKER